MRKYKRKKQPPLFRSSRKDAVEKEVGEEEIVVEGHGTFPLQELEEDEDEEIGIDDREGY